MIRSIFCPKDAPRQFNLTPEQMAQALQNPEGLLWVSLEQPVEEEIHAVLRDVFHFHPLAIEDCMSDGYQAPKVDVFSNYLFIIVHALRPDFPLDRLDTVELNCFLGQNYLVTSYLAAEMASVRAVGSGWNGMNDPLRTGLIFCAIRFLTGWWTSLCPCSMQWMKRLTSLQMMS